MVRFWPLVRLARRFTPGRPENPYFDPSKPHHTRVGFRNNHPPAAPSAEELARLREGAPPLRGSPPLRFDLSPVRPDLAFLHGNRELPSVTWIGHSTVLMQVGGRNILTDPIFSARASPIPFMGPRRRQPPGVALRDLPHIDLVVISHNHYDHLDRGSVRALARQRGGPPSFAVPLGIERWFARNVRRIGPGRLTALDWWESADLDGIRVTLAPVHHWSARTPWDHNQDLWGGWCVEREGFRFFFSGDIAYSADAAEIGRRLGPFDLAAIAVGHYEPRWFMRGRHVNPDEAVRVHRDIRSRRSVGIHFGTFEGLTAGSLDQPLFDLAEARRAHGVSEEEFFTLRHGETRILGQPL
jgi:L-ascorbate metabolism protein UlaG (beta-lactamase superfamily)